MCVKMGGTNEENIYNSKRERLRWSPAAKIIENVRKYNDVHENCWIAVGVLMMLERS